MKLSDRKMLRDYVTARERLNPTLNANGNSPSMQRLLDFVKSAAATVSGCITFMLCVLAAFLLWIAGKEYITYAAATFIGGK